ncbi:MAG: BMP family ABC transporter substrate-binding protein, partial [Clostridia bacterium]|nr:BMP family ABC transporter substrate-binding protein [Clostridia bacterium]
MKKLLALLMVVAMLCLLCACTETPTEEETSKPAESDVFMAESTITLPDSVDYSNIKVGLICLHDENSTYDNNFIQALKDTQTKLGLKDDQVLIKTNIEEGSACYDTACELVDEGCNIIFADSFGHESYMIQAAEKYPEVQFCHATGTQSQVKKLANYHNAFASIYEGR